MDWGHFLLRESPFSMSPDPAYLYLTSAHEGALSNIIYGIGQRRGFILVTGEVGTGKTTLCRALANQLDQTVHKALILSSNFERDELIGIIAADFGCGEEGRVSRLEDLNGFLVERLSRGENAVVIIDEAQNLPDATLEELRLISNLETDRQKLLQIVLVGQPELREKLRKPSLRSLDQRIAVRYHLRHLSASETEAYVLYRISVASIGEPARLFSPGAIRAVHHWSGGYPRLINVICDRALVEAQKGGAAMVQVRHVKEARKGVGGDLPGPRRGMRLLLAGAAAAAILLLLFSRFVPLSQEKGAPDGGDLRGAADEAARPQGPVPPEPHGAEYRESRGLFRAEGPGETLNSSLATLFALWGMDFLAGESLRWKITNVSPLLLQTFFDEMEIAEQYGVVLLGAEPDPATLRRVGLPCLFSYRADTPAGRRYAVLAGIAGGDAVVYDPLDGRREVALGELLKEVDGSLYYLLRGRGEVMKPGQRGSSVMALQEKLQRAGFYRGEPDGVYGVATEKAVRALQGSGDIAADGVVGLETGLLLDRLLGLKVPTLDDPAAGR